MTAPLTILDDLPRGVRRRGDDKTGLEDHILPRSQFRDPRTVLDSKVLQYAPHKVFLGVVDGTVNTCGLPDGRVERHIMDGHAVGIADDRHMVTVAGSRSGNRDLYRPWDFRSEHEATGHQIVDAGHGFKGV